MIAGYGWAGRLVGVLLLAAAGAKLFGWNYQPLSETAWLATPSARAAAVALECALGLWLLTGMAPVGSWLASLGVFASFAAVSGYRGWLGIASCECFGALTVSPWISFGLDVAVWLLLIVFRPRAADCARILSALKWAGKGAIGVAILVGGLLALGRFCFSSPQEALAFLRGERVALEQSVVELGAGQHGEWRTASVTVQNWSDKPVRIVGANADCACVVAEDLPLTVAPRGKAKLPVRLHYPSSSTGQFWKELRLVMDDASPGQLVVVLAGSVVPKE